MQNPHDQYFKETLAQPGAAVDFLRYYLPARIVRLIEPETAEWVEDSFVDEELKEHLSDLLFRVKLKKQRHGVYLRSARTQIFARQMGGFAIVALSGANLGKGATRGQTEIAACFFSGVLSRTDTVENFQKFFGVV